MIPKFRSSVFVGAAFALMLPYFAFVIYFSLRLPRNYWPDWFINTILIWFVANFFAVMLLARRMFIGGELRDRICITAHCEGKARSVDCANCGILPCDCMECSLPQRSKGDNPRKISPQSCGPCWCISIDLHLGLWMERVPDVPKEGLKLTGYGGCCELFNSRFVFESLVRIVSCSENAPQPRREAFRAGAPSAPSVTIVAVMKTLSRREFLIAASAATVAIAAAPAFAAGPLRKGVNASSLARGRRMGFWLLIGTR